MIECVQQRSLAFLRCRDAFVFCLRFCRRLDVEGDMDPRRHWSLLFLTSQTPVSAPVATLLWSFEEIWGPKDGIYVQLIEEDAYGMFLPCSVNIIRLLC